MARPFIRTRACFWCGTEPSPQWSRLTGRLLQWRGPTRFLRDRSGQDAPWVCEGCALFAAEVLAHLTPGTAAKLMLEARRCR
jgi:hypothetical protein